MPIMLVRRGLGDFYYMCLRAFAAGRNLTIALDRRTGDRRHEPKPVPADRRRADRRGPAPRTWEQADFIVLPDPPEEETGTG